MLCDTMMTTGELKIMKAVLKVHDLLTSFKQTRNVSKGHDCMPPPEKLKLKLLMPS